MLFLIVLQTPKLPKPRSCAEEWQMGCGFALLMPRRYSIYDFATIYSQKLLILVEIYVLAMFPQGDSHWLLPPRNKVLAE